VSKSAGRNLRKRLRQEALEALAKLSREELVNVRNELGREMGLYARRTNELRIRLDAVRSEFERRNTSTPAGVHISDHALVRYMERVKGVDVDAMRAEIGEIALRSKNVAGHRLGQNGRRLDDHTGLTVGVDENTTVVTTIFVDDELPIMRTE
jgi:hypothetical protein